MKHILKPLIPKFLLQARRDIINYLSNLSYRNKSAQEVFHKIYQENIWGGEGDFHSGSGSADSKVIQPYVKSLKEFCASFENKPTAVDLGCGDFIIGSQTFMFFSQYTACDVVKKLIDRNAAKYNHANLKFVALDAIKDAFPQADILIIRQVLQHLSNKDIINVILNIGDKFRFWVVTEEIPTKPDFIPNLDKPTGPHIRMVLVESGSGVVLTKPPFNIKPKSNTLLCHVDMGSSVLETRVYEFGD
jgi:hypothetical protein